MPSTDYSEGTMPLPADPIAIPVARQQVRRWLAVLSWPAAQLDDIVLAVSEAVTNAVEHAYINQLPGVIEVRGVVEALVTGLHRVTVIVRDYGRWRLAPAHDEHGHRGISIMRACMETVTIGPPDDGRPGTRVVLRSKNVLVPARGGIHVGADRSIPNDAKHAPMIRPTYPEPTQRDLSPRPLRPESGGSPR